MLSPNLPQPGPTGALRQLRHVPQRVRHVDQKPTGKVPYPPLSAALVLHLMWASCYPNLTIVN